MNELETEILILWRRALELPDFGLDDNFFAAEGTYEQGAHLISALEKRFNKVFHVTWLVAAPSPREQLRWLNSTWMDGDEEPPYPEVKPDPAEWREIFRAAFPARFDELLPPRNRIPGVCFIHSPARSGSTLLRTMLAGHRQIFAPPELELLLFPDMKTRFHGLLQGWADLHGLDAAVASLWGCSEERTAELLKEWLDKNLSTFEVYRMLQERAVPRILVDKTPSSATVESALKRCKYWFRDAQFIHLVRHPLACIRSWKNSHFEQVVHAPPRAAAEMNWLLSHKNILKHLDCLNENRYIRIHYEKLIAQPEETMQGLAAFLGVEFHPSLLDPYSGERMTKHSSGRIGGDRKFHLRRSIDRTAANSSRRLLGDGNLLPETVDLARHLGYDDL